MSICCMGIDPGLSGAISFFFPDHADRVTAEDVPVAGKLIDGATLRTRIEQMQPNLAVIEAVASRPKQGVASVFTFGRAFGTVIGVVSAMRIPLHYVTPQTWMKFYKLRAVDDASRELALRLFPATAHHFARKKDHNRADAALIARWGAVHLTPASFLEAAA